MNAEVVDAQMLQEQLFRYAHDIQELMVQHTKLQRHHALMLQAIGRDAQDNDLLFNVLRDGSRYMLVTDVHGLLMQASAPLRRRLGVGEQDLQGGSVTAVFSSQSRTAIHGLVKKIALQRQCGGLELQRLALAVPQGCPPAAVDVLVMQSTTGAVPRLYWWMQDAHPDVDAPMSVLERFLIPEDREEGVFCTNPQGDIQAINAAFTHITGYSAADVLGENPRVLSSGGHDSDFYQDFWTELLAKGHHNGEVFNRRKNGQLYLQWVSIKLVQDERDCVVGYVAAISDLSRREREKKQLEELAFRDQLTGLPNRRWFEEQVSQALAIKSQDGTGLSILFMDLDKFKPINDELGHEVGDKVLQTVAQRLQDCLHQDQVAARIGGDEFVVLLKNSGRDADAENFANSLLACISAPIALGGETLAVGASIGCAIYPRDGVDGASLMRNADAAMYGAKRFGTQFSFFDTGAAKSLGPNLAFDLWHALERNELSLVYQPQISLDENGAIRGYEALLRWQHPQLGEVQPSVFIPVAEKTGAIVPIGKWVLATACGQLVSWIQQGRKPLSVSVNISLQQLRAPDFIAYVREQVFVHQIDPGQLELELSETQAQLYLNEDTRRIQALREMGVRIAIKDFGVAFGTLSRLSALSISSLKIDPKLVAGLAVSADARAISNCMVAVGLALNIDVIAEGVESTQQLQILREQRCPVVQGFLTGSPMPPDSLQSAVPVLDTDHE